MNVAQTVMQQWAPRLPDPPAPHGLWVEGRFCPIPRAASVPQPEGYPRIAVSKIGDKYLVCPGEAVKRPGRYDGNALRFARRLNGVGRPPCKPVVVLTLSQSFSEICAEAITLHGSQRKAAAALGISLGKLQRGLRK